MTRSDGERVRIAEQIRILRALLDAFELTVSRPGEPTSANAQSVADSATRLVTAAGRLDAYTMAERGGLSFEEKP